MSRKEQILYLNNTTKCILKPSPIHGIGVFAIRDIPKGSRCYVRRMRGDSQIIFDLTWSALQEVDEDIRNIIVGRWPNVVNDQPFYGPLDDARLLSFCNHSDTPNYTPVTDLALKDIKAGEEITEDYRIVKNYKLAYPFL